MYPAYSICSRPVLLSRAGRAWYCTGQTRRERTAVTSSQGEDWEKEEERDRVTESGLDNRDLGRQSGGLPGVKANSANYRKRR